MIKVEELRIGNWVDYKGSYYQIYDGIRSLSIDDLDSESLDSHLKNIMLKYLKPIPLTEEILLKCGFGKSESWGMLFIKKPYVLYHDKYLEKNILGCYMTGGQDYITISKPIKYLHQLQNLYYALTGQELEIKL